MSLARMLLIQVMLAAAGPAPVLAQMAAAESAAAMAPRKSLHVSFAPGSARIAPAEEATLDAAVRTFRSGDWLVLEIAGGADTVGGPVGNLDLSYRRARAVAEGLIARGVSPRQLQLRARGESELETPTPDETAEAANRVAEITWR